jgi:hypothetical protein
MYACARVLHREASLGSTSACFGAIGVVNQALMPRAAAAKEAVTFAIVSQEGVGMTCYVDRKGYIGMRSMEDFESIGDMLLPDVSVRSLGASDIVCTYGVSSQHYAIRLRKRKTERESKRE